MSHAPRADDPEVLLRRAAAVCDAEIARADLQEGYQALHQEIVRHGRAQRLQHQTTRRSRARRGLLLGAAMSAAAVFAAAPTGAAATEWLQAHTGLFGSPGATENGTGEFLDTSAGDFPGVARHLASGITYPPGDSADTYIASLASSSRADQVAGRGRQLMEATGVRQYLRLDATCAWSGYWLDATGARDTTKQALALRGLSDPAPDPAYVVVAARRGETTKVRVFWTANCAELPQPWKRR